MIHQLTPSPSSDTETTASLPKFGWIRVRRKDTHNAASPVLDDASWTPLTSGPYIVPITRWIE
jgi:hypothetical protein